MKRFQMFLPEQTLKKLEKVKSKTGTKVAELIRRAVDAWLKKEGY